MRYEVVIAGAGPAGAIAALVLARAGARVLVLDRARFPRPKLCGDTVNPGALRILLRLGLGDAVAGALPIGGMLVTGGTSAVRVLGLYPDRAHGVSLSRSVLDARLVDAASAAGARIDEQVLVRAPLLDARQTRVTGVEVTTAGGVRRIEADVVIAADGHFSRLARALNLSRSAAAPRRWALGGYFESVSGLGTYGEMHVRSGHYVGVAPLPDGSANACLVSADTRLLRSPRALASFLINDPTLGHRFAAARLLGEPTLLGPLAVDGAGAGMPGLLLAGDAAGFIDPITGDGLRFAFRGGELAAVEALAALRHGWRDAHVRLWQARRREFAPKWRFNRAVRGLVGARLGVHVAAHGAAIAPAALRHLIAYAGDVR